MKLCSSYNDKPKNLDIQQPQEENKNVENYHSAEKKDHPVVLSPAYERGSEGDMD